MYILLIAPSAWSDSWSLRWNRIVFAEHGYVVVAVNPTGSKGYGQKFQNDIKGQCGLWKLPRAFRLTVSDT
jgi:dipeptidyl aminopeptidase/acylaminoacyl peptidase